MVFAQDNSASMAAGLADTAAYRSQIESLLSGIDEKYSIDRYEFGTEVREGLQFSFDEKLTNMTAAFSEIYDRYANQNVGAIVLATDGIFNEGSNPVYFNKRLDVPVYSIALGDTTLRKDVKVERVYHNRIAYLRDKFTIRVDLTALNCAGESTFLSVYQYQKGSDAFKEFGKTIKFKNTDDTRTVDVVIEARVPGINQYTIRAKSLDGEVTEENNVQRIYIDILDARQKILLLAEAPHPDLSALKSSIEKNENYEVDIKYARTFNNVITPYDLLILHGIPSSRNPSSSLMSRVQAESKPVFYILTTQSNIPAFNQSQQLLQVNGASAGQVNNSKPELLGGFNLFTIDNAVVQNLANLPPLNSPFGEYAPGPKAVTLLKQKIGTVSTNYPLLVLEQSNITKSAVLAGEGLWRWRIYDYQTDSGFETVDEIIGKTIQYLSVKNDKRQFRISTPKNMYYENESITFDAELYNDSYELINESEVNLSIYDENGKEYPFVFNKSANAYRLDAGLFPVGDYTFKGRTRYAGNSYDASGKFSVIPLQIEALNTTANHSLLYNLADRSGGKVFTQNQIADLASTISSSEEIKPVMYSNFKNKAFINLKWLFFVILALVAIEWFIRKFNGGY